LFGVVLSGEIDEIVSVFPEYEPRLRELDTTWKEWIKKHEAWLDHIKENNMTNKEIGLQTPSDINMGLIFDIHNGKVKNINGWVDNQVSKRTFENACKYILNIIEGNK
jgi:predicted aldo/keto reductase-like oxidoreductase